MKEQKPVSTQLPVLVSHQQPAAQSELDVQPQLPQCCYHLPV